MFLFFGHYFVFLHAFGLVQASTLEEVFMQGMFCALYVCFFTVCTIVLPLFLASVVLGFRAIDCWCTTICRSHTSLKIFFLSYCLDSFYHGFCNMACNTVCPTVVLLYRSKCTFVLLRALQQLVVERLPGVCNFFFFFKA